MPHLPMPLRVRFGRFELDAVNADLRKDGRRLRLRPQAFTLLTLLVGRAGELVTRDELRLALWPEDTFVDFDHGLNATIAEVRRALSDTASRGRLIETVPRKGYRFVGEVEVLDASRLRRRRTDQAPTQGEDPEVVPGALVAPVPVAVATEEPSPSSTPDPLPSARHRHRGRRLIAALVAAACLLLAVRSVAGYLQWPWRDTSNAPPTAAARRGGTARPDAWQAYARARVFWNTRSDCARATVEYREAARLDPAFALPWIGIADCYTVAGNRQEAQAAVAEAERRAPSLGEVHASRGLIRMFLSWDWQGAEDSFTTAMRLSPEYASSYQWAGLLAMFRGDVDTGHTRLTRALALDPASAVIAADLAWAELARGRPQEALALCRQAQRLTPQMVFTAHCLVSAWQRLGRMDEVQAVYSGAPAASGRDAEAALGKYYAYQLEGLLARTPVPAHMTATYYAALGNTERALYWLEVAVNNQEFMTPFTVLDPRFDALRRHPKFRELMDRAGLATGEPRT